MNRRDFMVSGSAALFGGTTMSTFDKKVEGKRVIFVPASPLAETGWCCRDFDKILGKIKEEYCVEAVGIEAYLYKEKNHTVAKRFSLNEINEVIKLIETGVAQRIFYIVCKRAFRSSFPVEVLFEV